MRNFQNCEPANSFIVSFTKQTDRQTDRQTDIRPTLDGRLSALPSFNSRNGRISPESRQPKTCLKKIEEVIALTSREDITLTLDNRLSANFR